MDIRHGKTHKDKLKTRVEGRGLEREMITLRVKERMERERMITEAQDIVPNLEFWCDTCKKDFIGFGYKQKRVLPLPPQHATTIGFWYGHCPVFLHRCIRRITDKEYDTYYAKSELVLAQAKMFADDLMGPDDPRFALRYPKEYERYITDNGEQPDATAELR